jgi:CRP-like cAMP-binding protein
MDPLWSNIFRRKLDEDSLAHFLRHLAIFAGLTPNELRLVEGLAHKRNYRAHETIFEEGEPGTGMYMIRSGSVTIYAKDTQNQEYELTRLTAGDFFGETTLTAPAPRGATARTNEPAELIGLFRADLLSLVATKPEVVSNILLGLTRVLSERLQATNQEMRRLRQQIGQLEATGKIET